jgi:hypothetical protein
VDLPIRRTSIPAEVRLFLREARRRIERFRHARPIPGFVPSYFEGAYRALRAVAEEGLAPGDLLCEWGSGFGVVACLAAMLDFDACGVEIESDLVDEARRLADDFGLPVELACGSFIPQGGSACLDEAEAFAWLVTEGGGMGEELEIDLEDVAVVFCYPWPDEERLVGDLFARFAAENAVLLTHDGDDFRLRRKAPGHR